MLRHKFPHNSRCPSSNYRVRYGILVTSILYSTRDSGMRIIILSAVGTGHRVHTVPIRCTLRAPTGVPNSGPGKAKARQASYVSM